MKKAIITLSNGTMFSGTFFGSVGNVCGQGVVHSGSVGYTSEATAKENEGKVLISSFPMIGNYGIISEEIRSDKNIAAHILFEWCEHPSNFACEKNIDNFYKERSIVGVCAVDTRALIKRLNTLYDKTVKISAVLEEKGE